MQGDPTGSVSELMQPSNDPTQGFAKTESQSCTESPLPRRCQARASMGSGTLRVWGLLGGCSITEKEATIRCEVLGG